MRSRNRSRRSCDERIRLEAAHPDPPARGGHAAGPYERMAGRAVRPRRGAAHRRGRAPGAGSIAESDLCAKAYVAGRSLGLQFHPEVTPEIMDQWVSVYPHELEAEGVAPRGLLEETRRRAAESRAATGTSSTASATRW